MRLVSNLRAPSYPVCRLEDRPLEDRSDAQLILDSKLHVKQIRTALCLLLKDLREIERRMLFAQSHSSLFNFMVNELGLCEPTAYRKLEVVRLMRSVPHVADLIGEARLTLSAAVLLRRAIRTEEERLHCKFLPIVQAGWIEAICGMSVPKVERWIAIEFPNYKVKKEELRAVGDSDSQLTVILTEAQLRKLIRVKELTSHSNPGASWAELIERLSDEYIERHDPIAQYSRAEKRRQKKAAKVTRENPTDAHHSEALENSPPSQNSTNEFRKTHQLPAAEIDFDQYANGEFQYRFALTSAAEVNSRLRKNERSYQSELRINTVSERSSEYLVEKPSVLRKVRLRARSRFGMHFVWLRDLAGDHQ